MRQPLHLGSSFDKFCEHFFGVDGNEYPSAASQDLSTRIHDFRHVDVMAAVDTHFPALDS